MNDWKAEVEHLRKLNLILETRLYLAAQRLHHQSEPTDTPNGALLARVSGLENWLRLQDETIAYYKVELTKARQELRLRAARLERLEAVLETESAWAAVEGAEWCLA